MDNLSVNKSFQETLEDLLGNSTGRQVLGLREF